MISLSCRSIFGIQQEKFYLKLQISNYFYNSTDPIAIGAVQETFYNIADIQSYKFTNLKTGRIDQGRLGRLYKMNNIATGEIVKFENSNKTDIRLVGRVHYSYDGKAGFFLTPFHPKKKAGQKLIDQRENLHRIEFDPFIGDNVLGMYVAWHDYSEIGKLPLILCANTKLDKLLGIGSD